MKKIQLSASIVIYNEDENTLKKSLESFVALNFIKELIIIDNSPKEQLREFCESYTDVKYIFLNKVEGVRALLLTKI